jgi:RNA polymerase sigma-70 factor (ECF subfamily)
VVDLAELYAGSYRRLVTSIYAVIGDLTDAEEVVQEAFVKAIAQPGQLSGIDNPEGWLFRVALNLARTRARRRVVFDKIMRRTGSPPVETPDQSPDHVALMAALRRLPVGQREALGLHYLVDLPVDEVAAVLGVSVGTVKSRLARGRSALAQHFTEDLSRVGGNHD